MTKGCVSCGKEFEDFSTDRFVTYVCEDCFAKSCIEVDKSYKEKEKQILLTKGDEYVMTNSNVPAKVEK